MEGQCCPWTPSSLNWVRDKAPSSSPAAQVPHFPHSVRGLPFPSCSQAFPLLPPLSLCQKAPCCTPIFSDNLRAPSLVFHDLGDLHCTISPMTSGLPYAPFMVSQLFIVSFSPPWFQGSLIYPPWSQGSQAVPDIPGLPSIFSC